MQIISEIWYVSFDELVSRCGVSPATVKSGMQRGSRQWQSITDPDDKRKRLIRYDTLSENHQALVRRILCGGYNPGELPAPRKTTLSSERSLPELTELALTETYRRYTGLYPTTDTSRAALKTQTCLARAAAVVEMIGQYVDSHDLDRRSYGPYRAVLGWLTQDNNYDYYFPKGHQYLPAHEIRLKEKVLARFGWGKQPAQPITEVIHLPRKGNTSRDTFASDKELLAWVAMARMQGTNDPNAYVTRKISEVCRLVGKPVPSKSWFSQVLASPKLRQLTAPTRFGSGTANGSRYTHSITMARAMYAGDCWMVDATRVNYIEHRNAEGKFDFLFVIVVRDAYSGEVVGCHFDTKEDRWGYTNAFNMAVKTTGYLPHTLVYDRFPGHLTDEMQTILTGMESRGVHLVCTHKATGKALLERWFDTLQTVFLTQSRYYYGEGIRSTRPYAHRSPDHLVTVRKEAHKAGWDFDRAWQNAWERIDAYRNTPLSYYSKAHKGLDLTPAQLHEQSEKPNVINIPLWEQSSLFWLTKVLDIRRSALTHEVHGVRYEYPIYDTNILYTYKRVAIRYEEADPTRVMVFAVGVDDNVTDFFITELTHTTPIVMYGPDAQTSRLAGRQAKIKAVADKRKADLADLIEPATVDPEYLLTLGGKVNKDEFESAQSRVLYEQMGAARSTQAQTPATRRTPEPQPAPVFDPADFVRNSFYNQ